jgi:hypothetical protein
MTTLMIVFVGAGLLLIALSIPLLRRQIKPNWIYGFRTPRTIANPDLWYDINAYGAKGLLATGVAIVLASILLYAVGDLSEDAYGTAITVVMGVGVLLTVAFSWWKYLR